MRPAQDEEAEDESSSGESSVYDLSATTEKSRSVRLRTVGLIIL